MYDPEQSFDPDGAPTPVEILRLGGIETDAGRYEDAARLLRDVLGKARGTGTRVERLALWHFARLFVRERREVEALCMSLRLAKLAETACDVESTCFAHAGVVGALGHLEDWTRFDVQAARLEKALGTYRGAHAPGLMRHLCRFRATRELARDDVRAARHEMRRMRAVEGGPFLPVSERFACLVEALVELADGRPQDARSALVRADGVKGADHVHGPLRAFVAARCACAIDGPESGRASISIALYATEAAIDGTAARLRYALLLAELAERECGAPDLAKRAYEAAAAAVILRASELERAVRELPELAGEFGEDAAILTEYRRRFADEQSRVLEAVSPILRARIAAGDVPLWTRRSLNDAIGVCAWCLRVRLPDGTLLPVGHFLPNDASLRVSHGICPPCMIRISSTHHIEMPHPDGK